MIKKNNIIIFVLIILTLCISGCQSRWAIEINNQNTIVDLVTSDDVEFYISKSTEPIDRVDLGQILYASGFSLIEEIKIIDQAGNTTSFNWDDIAETSTISESGDLRINGLSYHPETISVVPSSLLNDIFYSIMDIAPTVAHALGLPALPEAEGVNWFTSTGQYDQAVMILLDGTQYEKLQTLIKADALPFFTGLKTIQPGLTVYPPITTSSTATLLTSMPPGKNGVFGYGYRSTELITLFDLAADNGLSVVAIEGASLPFNLRNAQTTLSGDRDGNGYSDDNVAANTLQVITSEMPDLLYVHFHEIDDMGHAYGPESDAYQEALMRVDGYLSQIYDALPVNTFIAIFADHGMHITDDGGNHGALKTSDLIIPIIFLEK